MGSWRVFRERIIKLEFVLCLMGFDWLYSFFISNRSNEDKRWAKEIIDRGGSDEVWVCFLGWRTSISMARKLNLLPKKGKIIIYSEPNALVNSDPNEAKKLFLELYADVRKHLKKGVNVFSISLGNMHGFYVASNYEVKRFVSLLPGPELGRNIWKSCAFHGICKKAKDLHFTQKEYDKILRDFECDHNYSKLPKNSVFYISKGDEYIPSEDQLELIREIRKSHNYRKISYFYFGHILSHVWFGILNTFGRIPWEE